jgi:septal ring factor EnvC (AmiA/AmiB activator)
LKRHLEATQKRVYAFELELLEVDRRLRLLFRELGQQERRLRPLVRGLAKSGEDPEPAQLVVDQEPAP